MSYTGLLVQILLPAWQAIDMQDITRLRNLLSEILLKGWPEKKYTDPGI
jgi:hypothetical protein